MPGDGNLRCSRRLVFDRYLSCLLVRPSVFCSFLVDCVTDEHWAGGLLYYAMPSADRIASHPVNELYDFFLFTPDVLCRLVRMQVLWRLHISVVTPILQL